VATFHRLTDARKWVQKTESDIREGRYFKSSESKKHTLAEAVDRYINTVLAHKLKSQRVQTPQLYWWKSRIGDHLLFHVTPALITQCREVLASEETTRKIIRSHATVNRYLAALSHLFTIAVKEWGWAEENPFQKVTKMKEPRGRIRVMTDEERARLLDACAASDSKMLYLIVMICLSTGARKMEVLGLQWNDVDIKREKITLYNTKNKEVRNLPLKGKALEMMRDYAKVKRIDTDYVFPNHDGDKPIDIRSAWEYALNKADIKDFRFHDLRHCAASYLAEEGATLPEIAAVLGHKSMQMVKRYAHISESHTASVIDRMNKKMFGGDK
jgi:integrase